MSNPVEPYGEIVVSWRTVWNDLFPQDSSEWHDDGAAQEIHRLRGLIAGQAAETEDVLGQILQCLDTYAIVEGLTAHAILKDVGEALRNRSGDRYEHELGVSDAAIQSRNHAVYNSVAIGSSWVDHATGGGEFVPVISMMGVDEYGEAELREDLALQHRATAVAVTILRALTFNGPSDDNS